MISPLHYITQDAETKSHVELAEEACAAGADWIQLRIKKRSIEEWTQIAKATHAICKKYGAKLIINDNIELALAIGADGVHLGKEDLSTAEAKKLAPSGFIIGGTANTFEDIKHHAAAGVDYIGLGPFRFTSTKGKLSPVLGVEGYREIMFKCADAGIRIPVIAIGGITTQDANSIIATGVYGIAVAGAITHAADKSEVIGKFRLGLNLKQAI
jgi:thiamine-phosphate pyrophosphorylase